MELVKGWTAQTLTRVQAADPRPNFFSQAKVRDAGIHILATHG